MSEWISVNERTPDDINMKKYLVKVEVGSINIKTTEKIVFGKMYPSQFRFMVGDWQRVTHWKDLEAH
jgi:hypothetical protein